MKYMFPSRRTAVTSTGGMVASSQYLATQAGVSILQQGGNAVDAAIATAAALNVVEPMMTGLGGDLFALVYLHKGGELKALNASGRAPNAASLEKMRRLGFSKMPETGIHTVTIPGTLDGWCTLLDACGTMKLSQVLSPAIALAEKGYPDTLKKIARDGREVFYKGEIAESIVACSQKHGGLITMKDLNDHSSAWVRPISANYRGYEVFECPPNGQGLVTLLALNMLEGYDIKSMVHNSPEYLHLLLEVLKLAFADADRYVADPDFVNIPLNQLLDKSYAESRRSLINEKKAGQQVAAGVPGSKGDTVYLAATDRDGNSISLINSLYQAFGSGVVVEGTGICLQNRGALFSLDNGHPNCIAPRKRPYHTIIPAMVLRNARLFLTFGVMGGFMQPQGQVQVLLNIIDFGMDMQTALDAPRCRYIPGSSECIFESGIADSILQALAGKGHRIVHLEDPYGQQFGGGQVIMVHPENGALIAGSDPRKDGCAMGTW